MSAPNIASRLAGDFLSALAEDWQRYEDALAQSVELRDFLASADHSADEKKRLLRQVFEGILDPYTLSLLSLLTEQGRLNDAPGMSAFTRAMLKRWSDTLTVSVTSASPLPAEEEETLIATLKERYGKEIMLEKAVDKSLIGGAVLRVGDKLFDGSIKSQLAALQKDLIK